VLDELYLYTQHGEENFMGGKSKFYKNYDSLK